MLLLFQIKTSPNLWCQAILISPIFEQVDREVL